MIHLIDLIHRVRSLLSKIRDKTSIESLIRPPRVQDMTSQRERLDTSSAPSRRDFGDSDSSSSPSRHEIESDSECLLRAFKARHRVRL